MIGSKSSHPAPPLMLDVIEEHLSEAAFLYTQWERALHSPLLTLSRVAEGVEARLVAHLDALTLVGKEIADPLLRSALDGAEPSEAFAAAWVLLSIEPGRTVAAVLARLADGELPTSLRRVLERALMLSSIPNVEAELMVALKPDSVLAGSILEVLAFRGVALGSALEPYLAASSVRDPRALMGALRAARASGPECRHFVEAWMTATLPEVRNEALETGLVLGLRSAWSECQRLARGGEGNAGLALFALAVGGEPAEQSLLLEALKVPALRPDGLMSLGFGGRVGAVESCLELMELPVLARLAGEAFSAITGLRIEKELVAEPAPSPEEPIPFEEEDLDANLVPGPEAELPVPNVSRVKAWWEAERGKFSREHRYVEGKPFSAEVLLGSLKTATMRRRHGAALEVAIRTGGAVRLQTSTWARTQRTQLFAGLSVDPSRFKGSFSNLLRN